jgi:hypothetical protein
MTTRPSSVSTSLELHLLVPGASALPIQADLRYEVLDPYAVTISFHTGSPPPGDVVEWTFARELLSAGTSAPSGEGDVQVWPSAHGGTPVACLSLSSPSGQALFEVPLTDLCGFLARTHDAVPSGTESAYVDLDGELASLLWAEPET